MPVATSLQMENCWPRSCPVPKGFQMTEWWLCILWRRDILDSVYFQRNLVRTQTRLFFKHIFLNTRSFIYSVIHSVCQSVSQSVIHSFFLLGGPERKCWKTAIFFAWENREQSLLQQFNPLSPTSDQHQISPCNINAL